LWRQRPHESQVLIFAVVPLLLERIRKRTSDKTPKRQNTSRHLIPTEEQLQQLIIIIIIIIINSYTARFAKYIRSTTDKMHEGKGRGHCHLIIVDIALLRKGASSQERAGMARVVDGFDIFACTPTN